MHEIKRVFRIDYYLRLFFEDGSVRAIDLAPRLNIDPVTALSGEPNTAGVYIHPQTHSIIWDDGTEISADFLHSNSQLIGWGDKSRSSNLLAWQPITLNTAEIKIDTKGEIHAFLLLDGIPFPALRISSATFGIHNNIAWYHVPFPGDDGVYEPEWEEPQIVFDTLEQLVEMVNHALEAKMDRTIDITERLHSTGREFFVESISPRHAAINANRYKKNTT